MQQNRCLKFRADIFAVDTINNNFAAIASRSQNIKIIAPQACKVVQNIYFDLLTEKTTAVAFHPTLEIIAIANGTTLYILNTGHHDIMQTIATHDGIVTILSFLQETPYLISGTANGRLVQYRFEGKSQISRLCSFPYSATAYKKNIKHNYVSAIAHNSEYLACSGYGGAVTLLKFHSHAKKFSFEISNSRVNALAFLDDKRIMFGNTEGTLYIAKIRKNARIMQINTPQRDITQILPLPKSHYVLIASQANTIMLFDTATDKIVTANFLTFDKAVRKMLLINSDELLIALVDNSIIKVTLEEKKELTAQLKAGNLLKVFKLLEANPMLRNTPEANKAEELYKELYSRVLLDFLASKEQDVLEEIKPFATLKSKKDEYKNLLLGIENYPKLQSFYKEYKFALAYALCEKFWALKFTPEYQKMEDAYKKSFILAQKQLLLQRPDKAKELLEPFITIRSKRIMVQLLLRQNKQFLEFLRAVSQKEYERVAVLVQNNLTFKEIPSYTALQEEAEKSLQTVKRLIESAKIAQAVTLIKELQHIPIIKEELQQLYQRTQEAKKLLHYYEKDNFVQCYETLDTNIDLESMQLAKLLDRHWNKIINECEIYALEGNIKAVKEALGELIHISTRRNKIGDLLRLSFHSKIKKELHRRSYASVENLIYSYMDIFGMDSEIKQLMSAFEKLSSKTLAITFEQQKHKGRDSWIYSDIM
jgi:hypothetical protein